MNKLERELESPFGGSSLYIFTQDVKSPFM